MSMFASVTCAACGKGFRTDCNESLCQRCEGFDPEQIEQALAEREAEQKAARENFIPTNPDDFGGGKFASDDQPF